MALNWQAPAGGNFADTFYDYLKVMEGPPNGDLLGNQRGQYWAIKGVSIELFFIPFQSKGSASNCFSSPSNQRQSKGSASNCFSSPSEILACQLPA